MLATISFLIRTFLPKWDCTSGVWQFLLYSWIFFFYRFAWLIFGCGFTACVVMRVVLLLCFVRVGDGVGVWAGGTVEEYEYLAVHTLLNM
jgi:hypothetical protein